MSRSRALYARPARGRRDCARCERTLPLRAFRRDARLQDGLGSWCRECHVAATREWRARNLRRINAGRRREYRANHKQINEARRAAYAARVAKRSGGVRP